MSFLEKTGRNTIKAKILQKSKKRIGKENIGIIVPRCDVKGTIETLQRMDVKYSMDKEFHEPTDIRIITKEGILSDLYSICNVALIGDTFDGSGQNLLEPAFYGKRIISGPKWSWNVKAYEGLKQSGLLKIVHDRKELTNEFNKDIDPILFKAEQDAAFAFIKSQQGTAKKYAQIIKDILIKETSKTYNNFDQEFFQNLCMLNI